MTMIQGDESSIGKGKIGSHDFMMFQYKISLCPKQGQKHEWEQCVYAHRGERARRRHPSKYQAVQCPEARAKKLCPRADDCNCTHNLWEYWLHPDRYMTCLCELGPACDRPICFFAHEHHELRPLPPGLSHPDEDMLPRPPRKERHQRNPTGSSNSSNGAARSCAHSPTQHLLQQSVSDPGAASQQSRLASSSRPDSSLGAAVGVAAGSAVEQGLAGAFRAFEILSVPDIHGGAGADFSPRLAQLPLQQQPESDMAPSGGTSAAASGPQILVAPALHTSVDHIQQQHQRASSAPTLASSQSFGLLSSSPTPQQQQQQLAEALMHQLGQQSLPQLLGSVGRQDSGAASSCSSGSGLPVLQGARGGSRQDGFIPQGQDLVRTSQEMHAVRTARSLSDGYMPAGMPASAGVLRLQGQQQGHTSRLAVSIPGSSMCSSPISLPVASLSPGISPMSAGRGVDGMMGTMVQPGAFSTAMMSNNTDLQQQMLHMQQLQRLQLQQLQQQQQQHHSGYMLGVQSGSLSPAQQAQLQMMQQQQQYGMACLPQQMMPVQMMDDGATENLSFSMWGPETAGQQMYMQQQQVMMPQHLAQQQQMVHVGQLQQQEVAMQQPVVLLQQPGMSMAMPATALNLSPNAGVAMQQGPGGAFNSPSGFQMWNGLQQQQQQQVALQQQAQQQALLQQRLAMQQQLQQQQPGQFEGTPPHAFWN